MKFLAVTGLLVLISFNSVAQFDQNKMLYAAKIEKYKRMKSTGILLSLAGTALVVTGISKMANATTTTTYTSSGSYSSTSNDGEVGALMFLAGTAGMGAGIPLWIVGSHAQHKYERKLNGILSVRMNMYERNKGLTLSYQF